MEEQKIQDSPTVAAGSATAPRPAQPDNTRLRSYEESCKKVREIALRQLQRFMSYEAKVLKGDDVERGPRHARGQPPAAAGA